MLSMEYRVILCVLVLLVTCLAKKKKLEQNLDTESAYDSDFKYTNENENNEPSKSSDLYDGNENTDEYLSESVLGYDEYMGKSPEAERQILKPMDTILTIMYFVITIVGLLANAVVFFVIFGGNEMNRTVTAIYVVQLAVADSAFLATLPIFGMQKLTKNWSFGQATCTLCQSVQFLNYYAGIFFLTAMSVDRFIAVTHSTKANQLRTKRRTKIVCAIVWLASFIMTLPVMIFAKTETPFDVTFCKIIFPGHKNVSNISNYLEYMVFEQDLYDQSHNQTLSSSQDDNYYFDDQSTQGNNNDSSEYEISYTDEFHFNNTPDTEFLCAHDNDTPAYTIWLCVNFIIGFFIPFLVISISYILILKRLRSSEAKIANMTGKRTLTMRRHVTRLVAALVVCFVVCWLPYQLFVLVKRKGLHLSVPACYGLEQFFVALAFSNSALNPILYTFLGHNFKERFRESVNHTKRKLRKGSLASATGQMMRSHSDHGSHPSARRMENILGIRRSSRPTPGYEANCYQLEPLEKDRLSGKETQSSFTRFDSHKSKEVKTGWKYMSDQNDKTEYTSRFHSSQTECSRIMFDKDMQ